MSQRREKERRYWERIEREHEHSAWLSYRPPWWKFWAVRKWKREEPR